MGSEPMVPLFELAKSAHALDRAATLVLSVDHPAEFCCNCLFLQLLLHALAHMMCLLFHIVIVVSWVMYFHETVVIIVSYTAKRPCYTT
jgi:hypothetical protein